MKRSVLKRFVLFSLYKYVNLPNRLTWSHHHLRQRSVSACDWKSGLSGAREKEEKQQTCYVNKSQLFAFVQFVEPEKLSADELAIHTRHVQALERGDDTYNDPATGNVVFTRLAHLRRGHCCGSACRHCPYGHKAVPADKPKITYNSAFYT
ncbi:hypothetical protein BsWGS_08956 [Bradybaena similaris]